jgi:hypothetical protein
MTQDQTGQAQGTGYARGEVVPDDETGALQAEQSGPMTRLRKVASALRGDQPEQTVPDQAVADQTVPNQAVPDQTVPNQRVPDQAVPDQAGRTEPSTAVTPRSSGPPIIRRRPAAGSGRRIRVGWAIRPGLPVRPTPTYTSTGTTARRRMHHRVAGPRTIPPTGMTWWRSTLVRSTSLPVVRSSPCSPPASRSASASAGPSSRRWTRRPGRPRKHHVRD